MTRSFININSNNSGSGGAISTATGTGIPVFDGVSTLTGSGIPISGLAGVLTAYVIDNVTPVTISTQLSGCLLITINTSILNAPKSVFSISKLASTDAAPASLDAFSSVDGLIGPTSITITWGAGQGVQAILSGSASYNGSYNVRVIF